MRPRAIVANWKMNATLAEARALAIAARDGCEDVRGVTVALCPPFTALATVDALIAGTELVLGAQDAYYEHAGAYTGAISVAQVADAGARLVIVGHSERRRLFGETDDVVRRKVAAVLAAGLTPIVCVGETTADRAAGRATAVVEKQLRAALAGLGGAQLARCWYAYEPVWAVGSGLAATPAQASEAHGVLRAALAELGGADVAAAAPILYGGSITPANTAALVSGPDVDGGLVGGAGLHASELLAIVRAAATAPR